MQDQGLPRVMFGEWAPDATKTAAGLRQAKGVVSRGGRYAPKPALSRYSNTARITSGTVIGAFGCYTSLGGGAQQHLFLAEARRIFRIAARVPIDLSRDTGGYTTADSNWVWSFTQFGDNVLAGARGVALQRFRFGEDRTFVDAPDVGASGIGAESSVPRTVDALGRIGPHVLAASGRKLQWCGFNNSDWWTPDAGTQAGETDLPSSGGGIIHIRSGESGAIFQERAISRIAYVGGATVFQLDEVETARGALSPLGVVGIGRSTFYASEEGFFLFDGLQSQNIGEGKVNKYFLDRLNYAYRHRVSASLDVKNRAIIIAYPANGSSTPNEQLIWSIADNRWTHDDEPMQMAWEMGREGISMDDSAAWIAAFGSDKLDDATPGPALISLDSPAFREGRRQWASVDQDGYLALFEGANRTAVIETSEMEMISGRQGWVTEVWPLIDAPRNAMGIEIGARLQHLGEGQAMGGAPRTNVCLSSHDPSTTWAQAAVGITAAQAGYEGLTTASLLKDTVDVSNTAHFINQSIAFTIGVTYTIECVAKASGRGLRVLVPSGPFGTAVATDYDLINGSIFDETAGALSTGMLPLGNGWWHCFQTRTATVTASVALQLRLLGDAGVIVYIGDGVSGVVLDGVQVRVGTGPSPIVPTGTAAVTLAGHPVWKNGFAPLRAQGRFLAARFNIAGGVTWTEATGFEHNGRPSSAK